MSSIAKIENNKLKCKHNKLSDNKENVNVNPKNKSMFTKKKLTTLKRYDSSSKVNLLTDFVKKEGNDKKARAPLKDIAIDLNKNCETENELYTYKKCTEECALVRIPEEPENSSKNLYSENSYIALLGEHRMKFITTKRNYDLSLKDHETLDFTLFHDISTSDKEDTTNSISTDISNTPTNTLIPTFCKLNIKEVRKNTLKDQMKLDSTQETLQVSQSSVDLYVQRYKQRSQEEKALLTKENIKSTSNIVQETYYAHCLRKNATYKPNICIFPGAVYLDPRENYVFCKILYSSPYLNHIVKYQLEKECNYKLSENFLKKHYITNTNRSIVVNWLIKLQAYMRTEHALIYTAVRLMDQMLDSFEIPLNMLQLVALASFWISLKYHAVDHRNASWMVKQSGGAYSKSQLVVMERQVFQVNNFDVNTIDLTVYVHYYILHLKIKNADIISQCSHYILDCALLDCRFVRILPSMLAAGAVFTSLHLMNQYDEQTWNNLHINNGYYRPEDLVGIKNNLIHILREVNNPTFQCREPYYKYSSSRYCNVTHIVLDALT